MVKKKLFKKNKKGWLKIVEAFISVLFLMGVLLIAIGSENIRKNETGIMHEKEHEILLEIAINQTLRSEVLGQENLPIDSTNEFFSLILKEYINNSLSDTLECLLLICLEEETCVVYPPIKKDVYAERTLITSNKTLYSPRILKIFCYPK